MSRKKIVFSDEQFKYCENMATIHCTGEEIASVMGVNYDTLNRIIKEKYKKTVAEFCAERNNAGKASLRRWQWKAAEAGNVTMLIWMGKQYLGQTDANRVEVANIDETAEHALMEALRVRREAHEKN